MTQQRFRRHHNQRTAHTAQRLTTEKALVADLVRPEQRGTAYGLYNLAFGVTTMHDPSSDSEMAFTNAELLKADVAVISDTSGYGTASLDTYVPMLKAIA